MLFRLALVTVTLLVAALAVFQLIIPALLNQPIFSWFRRTENALERSQRLRAEAVARHDAALQDIETIKLEQDTNRIRNEAFAKLTGDKKA